MIEVKYFSVYTTLNETANICISPYECGEIFAKQDGEEQMDRQTLGL